jgi:capsule polysaccharide modification protein KpsS
MRDSNDRRQPHTSSLGYIGDHPLDLSAIERRKIRDRRMENLSLEERQLLLSEMPTPPPESD